ncbi:MAG: alpha/beta hydrolase, partial [Candidatus Nanoarchaeia archaeon]|nr:alpha/beta hydrolase [Candidatus Nanoarchaeia archaeon]
GNGKSFRPEYYEGYEIDQFADDIYKILKKEGIGKIIFISHCFGNLVSIRFFIKHKQMVEGIVFISSYANQSERRILKSVFPRIFPPKVLSKFPSIRKKGYGVDYKKHIPAEDIDIKRMGEDILNTGFKPFLFILNRIFESDLSEDIKQIDVPVFIIHGNRDIITPLKSALHFKELIKGSKIKIIDSANHLLVLNNPKEITYYLKNFLDSIKISPQI